MRQATGLAASPGKATGHNNNKVIGRGVVRLLQAPAVVALAAALAVSTPAPAPPGSEPLCNLPPELSGELQGEKSKIRHPKSDQAARCTSKCVSTCVLGGYGAPGVGGPFNVRRYYSLYLTLISCSSMSISNGTMQLFVSFAHRFLTILRVFRVAMDGWMNVSRPLVVFKDTFRSRQYWYANHQESFWSPFLPDLGWYELLVRGCSLTECSDVCNLIKDGEDEQ
ncbi:hypothetical protein PR202_ga06422 [Eleusine coracana subsp. coracana]|uniref:Uncharacterized protein n=1 Tax=Eleusine coracana subsp. coracana TaxID=191504 RepID=A0AAV5BUT0_ELECO|nr:hypothetical protein PR202_ga06422 [Eleusine coracana subsp. coracana]